MAVPTLVPALKDQKCVQVAAGESVSFAVTEAGQLSILFTEFYLVLSCCIPIDTYFSCFSYLFLDLPSFTWFYRVLLSFFI